MMGASEQKRRILLIDDHIELCKAMVPIIQAKCKVDVVAAHTGDDAMDLLLSKDNRDNPYSLVILDMQVPRSADQGVDPELGVRILIELQNHYQFLPTGTPIIVYTAYPTCDNCVASIKAGAADYIGKDADGAEEKLLARINELLDPPKVFEDELRSWLQNNIESLIKQYKGRFIGVVKKEDAQKANLSAPEQDGYMLLIGDSREGVRKTMLDDKTLRWTKPYIIHIPTLEEYENG